MDLNILCSPCCRADLDFKELKSFVCTKCEKHFPVEKSILRFVPKENYADSFGYQWNKHKSTQLDKFNGLTISHDRLYDQSGWKKEELEGKQILECGSGAGRCCGAGATSAAMFWIATVNAKKCQRISVY